MTVAEEKFLANEHVSCLLEEAALNGSQRSERYPKQKFFGYFCSYWPEELVLAAGLQPLRILPISSKGTPAELPAYCCSLARVSITDSNKGNFKDLAGVGFAHTCDTMQCLGGIWAQTAKSITPILVPPVRLNTPAATKYYISEIEGLLIKLGMITGLKPSHDELQRAIDLCEHLRRLAAELEELREYLPSSLVSAIMRAGQIMPREDFARVLEVALPFLKNNIKEPHDRKRVIISGAVLENDNLYQMIEYLGGRIVADDTCTGFRHFSSAPVEGAYSPLEKIVARYSTMPPCPCRNRGLEERVNHLVELACKRKASGAILVIRKYCEPHAWDAVPISERLRANKTSTMVLELDGADVGGQERTRLQAFLESL